MRTSQKIGGWVSVSHDSLEFILFDEITKDEWRDEYILTIMV